MITYSPSPHTNHAETGAGRALPHFKNLYLRCQTPTSNVIQHNGFSFKVRQKDRATFKRSFVDVAPQDTYTAYVYVYIYGVDIKHTYIYTHMHI